MMKSRFPITLLIAATALWGCTGMIASVTDFLHTGPWWQSAQSDAIRLRAEELEARGDLAMALDHWRLVGRIDRDAVDAADEIARITKKIDAAVQTHFQQGLEAQNKERNMAARNHFLAALRLNPQFQPALKQLKVHYWPFPLAIHLSQPGDRPASIAQSVFGDENKGFLVAWFNDLPIDDEIAPGTLLILPRLETAATQDQAVGPGTVQDFPATLSDDLEKPTDTDNRREQASIDPFVASGMQEALRFFHNGLYRQSLDRIATVLAHQPDHQAAYELAAEARFHIAREHFDNQRYLSARNTLTNADPNHRASRDLMAQVARRMEERAQVHYRNGVKRFINEDLQAAIDEWEMTLLYKPDHVKARQNMENARRLLEKIERMP